MGTSDILTHGKGSPPDYCEIASLRKVMLTSLKKELIFRTFFCLVNTSTKASVVLKQQKPCKKVLVRWW